MKTNIAAQINQFKIFSPIKNDTDAIALIIQSHCNLLNHNGYLMQGSEAMEAAAKSILEYLEAIGKYNNTIDTKKDIPEEVLDLLRFMCETYLTIDKFVLENCDTEALLKYPVLQGTYNKINIQAIGKQPYDKKNIKIAVEWMQKQNI